MKLVKLKDEYYLLEADMNRMAKELPKDTLVFCLDEVHMNDPKECIRHSSEGDHCYGCQPLIGSTTEVEGTYKIAFGESVFKEMIDVLEDTTKKMWDVEVEMEDPTNVSDQMIGAFKMMCPKITNGYINITEIKK